MYRKLLFYFPKVKFLITKISNCITSTSQGCGMINRIELKQAFDKYYGGLLWLPSEEQLVKFACC